MPKLDGYSVDKQLAAGPLSEVWRGKQLETGRDVAIRFIKTDSLELTQRAALHNQFEHTAATASAIEHPTVVSVLAFGVRGGVQPFVVLELVEGTTLAAEISGEERRSSQELSALGVRVARALAEGHAMDLVHGDVRPENLLCTADGTIKLTEFGVAQLVEHACVKRGSFLRSPAYMAPELIAGEPPSAAADIFSLGATLYALLTGVQPFVRGTLAESAGAVRTHRPARPTLLRPGLPAAWDDLVERALAKDPKGRYTDADEMAAALGAIGLGEARGDSVASVPLSGEEREQAMTDTMAFERPTLVGVEPLLTDDLGACEDMLEEEAARALSLRVVSGPLAGRTFSVTGTLFFGRMRAQVTLPDERVSRRHARLDLGDDGTVTLTDLASSNGTFINGTPIGRVELLPGAEFQIGESVFRLELAKPAP